MGQKMLEYKQLNDMGVHNGLCRKLEHRLCGSSLYTRWKGAWTIFNDTSCKGVRLKGEGSVGCEEVPKTSHIWPIGNEN